MASAQEAVKDTLRIRAIANRWISDTFPDRRQFLSHSVPERRPGSGCVAVSLLVWNGKTSVELAKLIVGDMQAELDGTTPEAIAREIDSFIASQTPASDTTRLRGHFYDFRLGDGLAGSEALEDLSVDLLLTDPPYGISKPYICEQQVPRRMRKDGRDFIMPKGHFGEWDDTFPEPSAWVPRVLPKVRGWAVIFCAQAQIGEYEAILREHRLVAVGTLVWQKTNPVPFNHTKKPINAWEALVIGKRPGTKFNGRLVHNVFRYKSPSPQIRIHPTQKPRDLIEEFVKLFSDEAGTVLDPFAGSATTVVAGAALGRKVIAFESDRDMFNAAAERIQAEGLLL